MSNTNEVLDQLKAAKEVGELRIAIAAQYRQLYGDRPTGSGLSAQEVLEQMSEDALKQIQESAAWNPQYVNIVDYLRPEAGYNSYGVGVYPSTRSDRQDGRNRPIFQTEQELNIIRGIARVMASMNESAAGILKKLPDYCFGSNGFDVKVRPKHKEANPQWVTIAQHILDVFQEDNRFANDMDRESFIRTERDGENFLTLWHEGGINTQARFAEPEQITEPGSKRAIEDWLEIGNPSSWSFGILTDDDDVIGTHGYYAQWSSADTAWDFLPGGRKPIIPEGHPAAHTWCEHLKINTDATTKRGLSSFYSTQESLALAAKILKNSGTAGALQSGIAWIEQNPAGMTKDQVTGENALISGGTVTRTNLQGGTTQIQTRIIPAGSILKPNAGRTFEAGPGAEWAEQFMMLRDACLRSVAQYWSFPEHMITGDASNNNFASILVAGDPFVKRMESIQGQYVEFFKRIFWRVIYFAYKAGVFGEVPWQVIRAHLELKLTPPPVEVRDRVKETERRAILNTNKILSPQTWAAEEELDYEQEQINWEKVPQQQLPPSQQPQPSNPLNPLQQEQGKGESLAQRTGTTANPLAPDKIGGENPSPHDPNSPLDPNDRGVTEDTHSNAIGSTLDDPTETSLEVPTQDLDANTLLSVALEGNPNHKGSGPGGGQFTSGSGGSGGGSSGSSDSSKSTSNSSEGGKSEGNKGATKKPTAKGKPEASGSKTKLPSNPKKLKIAHAANALAEKGIELGKSDYDMQTKKTSYLLTHPDGTKEWANTDKIKDMLYANSEGNSIAKEEPKANSAEQVNIKDESGDTISKNLLDAAKTDPKKAAYLKSIVTDPKELDKLNSALGVSSEEKPKSQGLTKSGRDVSNIDTDISKLVSSGVSQQVAEAMANNLKSLANNDPELDDAVLTYQGAVEFDEINAALRTGGKLDEHYQTVADNMKKAIEKYGKLPAPVTTFRGVSLGKGQGSKLHKMLSAAMESGKPFSEKGFSSQSLDKGIAEGFGPEQAIKGESAYLFKVTAKTGLYANTSESELIAAPGTKYRVKGMTTKNISGHKTHVVEIEEV